MASENKSVNATTPNFEDTPQATTPINHNDIPRPRSGQKRRIVSKNTPNSNYPPTHGKFNLTNGIQTEAKSIMKSDSPELSIFVLLTVLELQTALRAFYNFLHSRETKMITLFSIDDPIYTLLLSAYCRCVYVTNYSATKFIFGLSQLKTVVEGIFLPVLAMFVETFGQVKLLDGSINASVFDSYDGMKQQSDFVYLHLEWNLNAEPVLRCMQASTRVLKNATKLRLEKYLELEGQPDILGNYRISENGTNAVTAFERINQKQAQLGAECRRTEHYNQFQIGKAIQFCFGAMPDMFLTSHIVNALRG